MDLASRVGALAAGKHERRVYTYAWRCWRIPRESVVCIALLFFL